MKIRHVLNIAQSRAFMQTIGLASVCQLICVQMEPGALILRESVSKCVQAIQTSMEMKLPILVKMNALIFTSLIP